MKKYFLVSMIAPIFFSLPLAAEEDHDKASFLVGIGVTSESGIYQDIDGETEATPIIQGEYGNFWIDGGTVGYNVFESESFSISPVINFSFDSGYDPDDANSGSQLYSGLSSLDSAIEAGFAAEMELGPLEMEFTYLTDVSSTHKGDIIEISVGEDIPLMGKRLVIEPTIGVTWISDEYNQHYYGVTDSQANTFRSAYTAKSSINYEIALQSRYKIGRKLYLLGRVALEKFDSELKNSPLVENDSETSFGIGIAYEF